MENKTEKAEKSPVSLREEATLAFWRKEKIFEKSLEKKSPKGEYIFYDGPAFANGLPHYGHLLASIIKDVIPRYKTMRGFRVPRRWGWDCHGLPIENLVERELGLKSKKDIESFGVEKFNEAARKSVMQFADEWRKQIPRIGRWVDMDNDYRTMDVSYTESIWWAFSELAKKGLIYEGFKAMHLCPHCETTLSNFEVAQGYKDIEDLSVYVKCELVESPGTFLVIWTTTPWTLPGNVAIAVNPAVIYTKIKIEKSKIKITNQNEKFSAEYFIVAKEQVLQVFKDFEYELVEEFRGEKLMGKNYIPPFDYYFKSDIKNRENGWKIYAADFVTTEEGTGLVHIAPAFGEDDLKLGETNKLPFVQHVGTDGKFKAEVTDFPLRSVKPKENHQEIDIEILKYLAAKNLLVAKKKVTHSYPHCWRCDTPLLNYAASSWFVKVSEFREKLVAENKKINWIPAEIRDGRFGNWLLGAHDWAISRSRFWGAPIPAWRCTSCGKTEYVNSLTELKLKTKSTSRYIITRHGEAENNVRGIISSNPDNPHHLTEEGRAQVAKAALKLKPARIDAVFSSPFLRTRETAEIIRTALGLHPQSVHFDERIRELEVGEFDGKPVDTYQKYFASREERFVKAPQGGETYKELRARMLAFLYDIDRRFSGKTILIVTHDAPAYMMLAGVNSLSVAETIVMRGENDYFISNSETREFSFSRLPRNSNFELDLHRPYIDGVDFPCACGATMKRVAEVFDCWFESGAMPFASHHYPFGARGDFDPTAGFFKKPIGYPADFIAEGLDQTRGWFYSMLVLSVALFGRAAYKSVIVNGIILAEDGQKMSKRLKNYPDPMSLVEKYGADAVRFYLLSSSVVKGMEMRFSERGIAEVASKVINRLENVLAYYSLYADSSLSPNHSTLTAEHVLDRWILARLRELNSKVTKHLEHFELDQATRPISEFIDDLSTWYLRRSRERFKGEGEDKVAALQTMREILSELSKLMAPFVPFLAEHMYGKVQNANIKNQNDNSKFKIPESVHLEKWPVAEKFNSQIIEEMNIVRSIVSCSLLARAKAKIKVRQPLARLKIKNQKSKLGEELLALIKDEVNVREIIFDATIADEVVLDVFITPELKAEGQLRELIRAVQDLRKKEGLEPRTLVRLEVETDEAGKQFIEKNKKGFMKTTSLGAITFVPVAVTPFIIDTFSFKFQIKKG